ncbi:MAG: ACP S-malonyltransferase [Thermoguttaceae bacterium]
MGKTAILFCGQGAQEVGMGKRLFDAYPVVRSLYERASHVLEYDVARLCFEGPESELDSTICSQPAIFVTSLAALEVLRLENPNELKECEVTAGLSLGEYTALVFADVFDFEDGLRLVQKRGEAMQEASDAIPSGMVSILGLEQDQVEALCEQAREGEVLQIANLLCPGNIVVSGTCRACERVAELAGPFGAMKAVPLAVAGAFHTPLMQQAAEKLEKALAGIKMRPPKIPVISNVDARPHSEPEEIRAILMKQLVQPVLWENSMRSLLEQGVDQFYELGPGRVLRGLLRRIDRKVNCRGIDV